MVLGSLKNDMMVEVVGNHFHLCLVVVVAEILHYYDLVVVAELVYLILVVVVALESYFYLSDLGLEKTQIYYLVVVVEDNFFELKMEDQVEIQNLLEDDFGEVLEIRQRRACD